MKIKYDIPTNIVTDIKSYLYKFKNVEEGGILLGIESKLDDDTLLVSIKQFHPIKSNPSAYDYTTEELSKENLPSPSIGYFPDPEEYLNVQKMTKTWIDTDLMEVGFVHNHYNALAIPSMYDLTKVNRSYGYLLTIYSNLKNELIFWAVNQEEDSKKCHNTNYLLPAQVELVAIF